MGGGTPSRRLLFDGAKLRGLRPDERSIAGHIRSILKLPVPPVGRFEQVSSGISHSGGGLSQTIIEWETKGIIPVVMDADGGPHSLIPRSECVGFVLSDDWPMDDNDRAAVGDATRVSLGELWLQGHSCISILHYLIDDC